MALSIEEVADLRSSWPAIESLIRDSHAYYLPIVGFPPPEGWEDEMRARLAPRPDALILLARVGGRPVAYANAELRDGRGYIDNVYVLSDARGNGIGHALADYIERWLAFAHIDEVRLHVRPANDLAMSFWHREGYIVVGEDGDMVEMAKIIRGRPL